MFVNIYRLSMPDLFTVSVIALLIWGSAASFLNGKKARVFFRIFSALASAAAVLLIILGTLVIDRHQGHYGVDMQIFHSLELAKRQPEIYRQLFMNALLFVPLGMTMPFALPFKRRTFSVLTTFVFALALSCFVEAVQFFNDLGVCEIDDVIMNITGASFGCLSVVICVIIQKVTAVIKENRKKKNMANTTVTDMNTESENVKVSVIIATYHRRDTLFDALVSLKNQTHKNVEIIVVDDNAEQEKSEDVLQAIEKSGLNVVYIKNEKNLSSAGSRNVGINAASGEYVTFLDDDDIYLPDKIKSQLSGMLRDGADYSITDLYIYNDKDELIDRRIRSYIKSYEPYELFRYHMLHHMTGTDTLMFKLDYLKKIGGFPPINVGDEFYLMKNAINAGGKFCYSPDCYVKAYVHYGEEGLSSGEQKIFRENALYKEKKKLCKEFSLKDKRYIKMRHYAVIAYADQRSHKRIGYVLNGITSFLSAPVACVKMLKTMRGKI